MQKYNEKATVQRLVLESQFIISTMIIITCTVTKWIHGTAGSLQKQLLELGNEIQKHTSITICHCRAIQYNHSVLAMPTSSNIKLLFSHRSTGDEEIRYELEKYFSDPYFVPKQVNEFGDEAEEEERFLAWIFMGAPGPGASLHVSNAHIKHGVLLTYDFYVDVVVRNCTV